MSFHVGQRVQILPPELHDVMNLPEGVITRISKVNIDISGVIDIDCCCLEPIPPTDDQLIKQLEEAGFLRVEDRNLFELDIPKGSVEVNWCDQERIFVRVERDVNWVYLPCKDLASAVRLGLTLVEVVK